MTTGFIDNDILLKLVAFQLLEETITHLGLTQDSLQVLSTARFFILGKQRKQLYSATVCEQAIAFVNSCKAIPNRYSGSTVSMPKDADPSEFKQLAPFSEYIDVGEVNLIVATRLTTDFLLLSGDKRCLKALSNIPATIYARLQGRAVCLEQIVLKMIDVLGFDEVCSRIRPAVQYDKAIQLCFGYSQPASEAQVREALQSCINEIYATAPELLMKLR